MFCVRFCNFVLYLLSLLLYFFFVLFLLFGSSVCISCKVTLIIIIIIPSRYLSDFFDFMHTLFIQFSNIAHYWCFSISPEWLFRKSSRTQLPFSVGKEVIKRVKQMCVFDYAQLPQFSPNLQIKAIFILLSTHLVSGTAANEPVTHTHTLAVSHHELLMSLSWLTVVKLKNKTCLFIKHTYCLL